MIMCTGFNCIPCMQKTALSSVLATSAQKRPFYELSPDTVQDVFYVLSLGPHFCHPIPSFDKSTGDGWGLITLLEVPHLNFAWLQCKHRPRNSPAKNTMQSVWVENC